MQVQQQIERLRVSQMEKQLQLKEASTRRKILALKQQLLSGNKPPPTAPAKSSPNNTLPTNYIKASVPSSKSDEIHLSSQSRTEKKLPQFIKQSPVPSLHEPHMRGISSISSHVKPATVETTTKEVLSQRITERVKRQLSPTVESNSKVGGTSQTVSGNKPTTTAAEKIKPKQNVTEKVRQEGVKFSSTQSREKVPHQKLTLPEEIKETEYMTALQRQKARVSRIRRCIVAATVIQRAWREYRNI